MKGFIRKIAGHTVLSFAVAIPKTRRLLSLAGIRATHGLFGQMPVTIHFADRRSLKLCRVDESYLSFQLFWHGGDFYEPITNAVLRQLLEPGSAFFDLGGHVGFYTLNAGLFCQCARIIAFEPNPNNFRLLKANVAENNLEMATCEPLAISDKNEAATLYLTESDMSASLEKGFESEDTVQIGELAVRTAAIDDYLEQHAVTGSLVFKVDIEGHEAAFFRGARRTLDARKPDIILEVLHELDPAIVSELKRLGYRFYPITDQGLVEEGRPGLVKRCPFLFLNHLLSTRPIKQLRLIFEKARAATRHIDLRRTSKHFPKSQWPLLWPDGE
jgi:FkbM family methyltransferase